MSLAVSLRPLCLAALALLVAAPLAAQPDPDVVATGVFGTVGIAVDADGRLWATQPGTGNDDGRVVVIDDMGQPQSFVVGIPSEMGSDGPEGAMQLLFDGDDLWVAAGVGSGSARGVLYRFDTTGFTPGDAPLSAASADVTIDIGAFVLGEGFPETNAYGLALGPDGTLFITDAGANAVIRRATDGTLSVLAALPPASNPAPFGPPVVQMVPTGIAVVDGRLFVAAFTGFPFVEGFSRVFEIDTATGDVTVAFGGLTSTVDLAVDPRGDALVALQFAVFDGMGTPPGFQPGSGLVRRLDDDVVVASDLSFTSALAYDADGALYIASVSGDIVRVVSGPVADDDRPLLDAARLSRPTPNPTAAQSSVTITVREPGPTRLTLHDALGRRLAVLVDETLPVGEHTVRVDASNLAAGVYVVRLLGRDTMHTQRVTVAR